MQNKLLDVSILFTVVRYTILHADVSVQEKIELYETLCV